MPPPTPKKAYRGPSIEEIDTCPIRGFRERAIKKPVAEFYGVRVGYDENGHIVKHFYPYGMEDSRGYKIRTLPKTFSAVGNINGLFGRDKFSGGGKRLVITEGEIDCMSVAQAYMDRHNKIYPVVAIPSAAITKVLLEERDWIRSFQEVVLMFDNDEPGKAAVEKAVKIVGLDKAKVCTFTEKDPNDLYIKAGSKAVLEAIWDAEKHRPAGLIGKDKLWEALVAYNDMKSIPYPACLEGLNQKLKGRRYGEISLFVSGTGSGKSTMMREIGIDILENTDDMMGIVSLEESPAETSRKFAGMAINRNPANEEIPLEELKEGFDKVFGDDRVVVLDHQCSVKDNSIIEQLEAMCLMGCKNLFVDHITILVSEGVDDLTGNEAIDKIMNDLVRIVKTYNVWIGLVSHLRKAPVGKKSFEEGVLPTLDDIRGSGSIKQVSFDIVAFARNLVAETEDERNTIKMSVLKSRFTGLTGIVPGAKYKHETGRLAYNADSYEDFDLIPIQ